MRNIIKKLVKYLVVNFFTKSINVKNPKGKVLVSFIVHPYLKKLNNHPNTRELFCIVECFNNLGYNVDVVDYRKKKHKGSYDIVFGFGSCYDYALVNNPDATKILYSTGSPIYFQNSESVKCIKRIQHKKKSILDNVDRYLRITEEDWGTQLVLSDSIISIGDDRTKSLFKEYNDNVFLLPPLVEYRKVTVDFFSRLKEKQYLWFGGKGSVHKGLDLVLEQFVKSGEKLYIAGPIENELEIYSTELEQSNITYLGMIDIYSSVFEDLMHKVSFIILPSCSEGSATSVLTCIYSANLIPIISEQCGLGFLESKIEIETLTGRGLRESLDKARGYTDQELITMSMSNKCKSRIEQNDEFIKSMKLGIEMTINQR
ncbi:TPA: hypothetical protein O4G62_003532 [Vibrio alginolyticus]|nr:hypothetical protein [Vibrio alginolyticus]